MTMDPRHPDWIKHRVTLELVRDLLGGTSAMRGLDPTSQPDTNAYTYASGRWRGATPWLPRLDTDSDASYAKRWDRAYLFGGLSSAVNRIVSDVFSEPISVEDLPSVIERVKLSADRNGTTLHRFAHEQFLRKVAFGASFTLVLTPDPSALPAEALQPIPSSEERPPTVSIEGARRFDVRPYLVDIHRLDIADWEFEETLVGPRLMWIEINRKPITRGRGRDAKTIYRRVRLEAVDGVVSLIEKEIEAKGSAEKSAWVDVSQREIPGVTEIPIVIDAVPDPVNVDGPMCTGVPFDELAWLNLEHFRVGAENGVALLTAQGEFAIEWGAPADDVTKPLDIGLGRAKRTTSRPDEYDIQYRGPSGKGVELGRAKLEEIESRMERLGAQPMIRQGSTNTATGRRIDEQGKQSQAMTWAADSETALAQALRIAARMAGVDEAEADKIRVTYKGIQTLSLNERDATFDHLLELNTRGIIDSREVLRAAVRLRILPADTDIDALSDAAAEEEAAKLRAMAEMQANTGQPDDGDLEGDEAA